ncbi:hypothetical protein JVU11DRAFT_9359 [Chiua virens]|nr:hypothetical protein JVU11DRAFT_9359 [Chiua virens]
MAREWRHLKMLKRSGRGHDPSGVGNTKGGECALLCPACPQPGKNLPDNWDKAPKDKQWLYTLFIALDANFRLKRRAVSQDAVDPSLGNGWSYFVEEQSYKGYLQSSLNRTQEKSACNSHSAVNSAEMKHLLCTPRNETAMWCGRCAKGYTNMNYLFFSVVKDNPLPRLNISYDIVCQWTRNLWERMKTFPEHIRFPHEEKKIVAFVPKFHLPAHVAGCQWKYSFNFIKGVGRTDGEAPECVWSMLNAAASSTKEMGPGHRRDTLDDLIGDTNWKKFIGIGESILLRLKEAVPERSEHREILCELEDCLSMQYGESLKKWKLDFEAWESDMLKPNPFEVKSHFVTQASMRLQLSKDDAQVTDSTPIHPNITASALISSGIDLEDQQRCLRLEMKKLGPHATERQKYLLQQRSNVLMRRMESWTTVQGLYMPYVMSLRAGDSQEDNSPGRCAAEYSLWLPSLIVCNVR